jgi:hypothetical protein
MKQKPLLGDEVPKKKKRKNDARKKQTPKPEGWEFVYKYGFQDIP